MFGQGRPRERRFAVAPRPVSCLSIPRWMVCLLFLACAVIFDPVRVEAEQVDLRFRFAWGGGEAKSWRATIQTEQGEFSELVSLGLRADQPGSVHLKPQTIHVTPKSPSTYDAFDVTVRSPIESSLSIEFVDAATGESMVQQMVPVADLIHTHFLNALDEQGNQLLVQRTPDDRLRIRLDRDSMVLRPGEIVQFMVVPNHCDVAPGASLVCDIEVFPANSSRELFSVREQIEAAADGTIGEIGPITFPAADEEGVYDVFVSISSRRLTAPFVKYKPFVQRKMQFVVVSDLDGVKEEATWTEQLSVDPANPGWWDRVKQLPQLSLLPGFGAGPLGNGRSRVVQSANGNLVELDGDGWQAYPLVVSQVGFPHILEIEYLPDHAQKLGVSIVELNEEGSVVSTGIDSGLEVPTCFAKTDRDLTQVATYQLVFWPKTRSPMVVLSNLDDKNRAIFGRLRVIAGPSRLTPAVGSESTFDETASNDRRLIAARFEKPIFPDLFGALKPMVASAGRTLDDWNSFLEGGKRMINYLEYAGYNSAMISVASDGSSIYPSQLLEPTPKYDSGAFFDTGQDPMRKDVLEMLFRLFDREGLVLIPMVDFTSPLPELESLRRQVGPDRIGIDMVDNKGRYVLDALGRKVRSGAIYNPLDTRVQHAMIQVVEEISTRYGKHASFGGIAIRCGQDTYSTLPGINWGCDERTINRYFAENLIVLDEGVPDTFENRRKVATEEGRQLWLAWRARKMSELYSSMQSAVGAEKPDAKLFLNGVRMFDNLEMHALLSASLVQSGLNIEQAMLRLGFDPKELNKNPDVVFLHGSRESPLSTLADKRIDLNLSEHDDARAFQSKILSSGDLFEHESRPHFIDDFLKQTAFGSEKVPLALFPYLAPSQEFNRERFTASLSKRDSFTMVDGGWSMPIGQEDSLKDLVRVYHQLPAEPFRTLSVGTAGEVESPVVVRTLEKDEATYFYVVNHSPWNIGVEIVVSTPNQPNVQTFSNTEIEVQRSEAGEWVVQLQMRPFDLQGGLIPISSLNIGAIRTEYPPGVKQLLRKERDKLLTRVSVLPQPPTALSNLSNPDFELKSRVGEPIPGWSTAIVGGRVTVDNRQAFLGMNSLKLTTDGQTTWVLSETFNVPNTGRLSLSVYAKIPTKAEQPPLRLAIQAKHHGEQYYKFGNVGAPTAVDPSPQKLDHEWRRFVVHFDDFPTEEITDMRIEFDLMGPGTVWIDNVKLYDRWIDENEKAVLAQGLVKTGFKLDRGDYFGSYRFLNSYWSRMLRQLDAERLSDSMPFSIEHTATLDSNTGDRSDGSVLDRMRRLVPKNVIPFR